jgi:undecaprenyl diphosphate synthase
VNYGSRAELVKAAKEIAEMARTGELDPQDIDENTISSHLYTAGQPEVDLMIRTSGEKRLSNFMLYQNAYSEFVFPETLWPDFSVHDYDLALDAFGHRQRRFGGRTSGGSR